MKAGRHTKLTPEVADRVFKFIRAGNYAITACQATDISEGVFYYWKKRGEREKSGIFFEFLKGIKKAEAEREARLVLIVQNAAPDNWQAAMTMLERLYPERWGRSERRQVEMTGKGGEPLIPKEGLTLKLPEGTIIKANNIKGNGHKEGSELEKTPEA